MTIRTSKTLLMGATALSLAALAGSSAYAASTGDQAVELVTVTAARTSATGLLPDEHISKQRSTITQAFLDTQSPGQTVFQGLNMVPGLNFTNTDPYGSSGGNIRLHGMDGARISFTWDGMPLNDTGNYAIFTNQVVDPELVDSVVVNQGTTDVDTPTASAVGGVIGIQTTKPADEMQALIDASYGSFNQKRGFVRLDTGTFGPWDTKAFASYSYQDYDKFKGPGHLQKQQINGYIYQDLGAVGFMSIGFHYNQNRNNFYNNPSYLGVNTQFAYPHSVAIPGGALAAVGDQYALTNIASPNVALDVNGDYTGVTPTSGIPDARGFGLKFDEAAACSSITAAVAGTADVGATANNGTTAKCTDFYKVRINPSDTGNIRGSSLFHITDTVSVTFDPSFQYVLANGGGITVINEQDRRLKGTSAAAGRDLNGDGDLLDQVQLYTPNNTNTRRYGLSTSVIWAPSDNHVFQAAYTLDWGLHRQTANYATFDQVTGPFDPFGGLKDATHRVVGADGSALRGRDRKSYAILNQFSAAYEGKWWDDTVRFSLGLRLPFLERDLNQNCYIQATGNFTQITPGVGFQYCTTEAPSAVAADGTVTFTGVTTGGIVATGNARFTPPGHKVVRYNRLLPNLGITYQPWGEAHQFFFAYATELSAPRTDNLYNGGLVGGVFSSFATVAPETSASYDLGYRYHGEDMHASITLWNTQFKNRIVSTFDPAQGISIDHNIGPVNMDGMDLEAGYDVDEDFNLYATGSYLKTRVVNDLAIGTTALSTLPAPFYISGGVAFAPTKGKQFIESPNYMATMRAQYHIWGFRIGVDGKFVGSRYATETNDYKVPSYFTANADVTYDLGELGWDQSYIKFNVSNIFDAQYFSSVATSRTCFTPYALTVPGCTSYPLLSVGSPRTFQVTLRSVF